MNLLLSSSRRASTGGMTESCLGKKVKYKGNLLFKGGNFMCPSMCWI